MKALFLLLVAVLFYATFTMHSSQSLDIQDIEYAKVKSDCLISNLDYPGEMLNIVNIYSKDHVLTSQYVYYDDGSYEIHTDNLQIENIELRKAYTTFSNISEKVTDNSSNEEFIAFNNFLDSEGMTSLGFSKYKEIIKGEGSINKISDLFDNSALNRIALGRSVVFLLYLSICVVLLLLVVSPGNEIDSGNQSINTS